MKGQAFHYNLAPTGSSMRAERKARTLTFPCWATNAASAAQIASDKAAEITKEKGHEYGVVRVY